MVITFSFRKFFEIHLALILGIGIFAMTSWIGFGGWNSYSIWSTVIGSLVISSAMLVEVFILEPDRKKSQLNAKAY